MKPLYVSYRCLTFDGKDATGYSVVDFSQPVSTAADIQELERKIISQEHLQSGGLTIYFWRRME